MTAAVLPQPDLIRFATIRALLVRVPKPGRGFVGMSTVSPPLEKFSSQSALHHASVLKPSLVEL